MKRFGQLIGGLSGFGCAVGFALLLLSYVTGGSGLQMIGLPRELLGDTISSGSIVVGLVHVMGFAIASFLCFAVGAAFCAHAIVPESGEHPEGDHE
jgi:hypothetical protein